MRHHIIILAFALLFVGCTTRDELAEALLENQEISITWKGTDGRNVVTTGVDPDQLVAAAAATEKILNHMIHGKNNG